MVAQILDGMRRAEEIKEFVGSEIVKLSYQRKKAYLVALSVGDDNASAIYLKNQKIACNEVGIEFELIKLNLNSTTSDLITKIKELNNQSEVTGIIVQLPLPESVDARKVQASINPKKDVEAITPVNLGKLILNQNELIPCTSAAVIELIDIAQIDVKGKEVVIVGHSEIVGKPIALLMLTRFATVTVCHIETMNLKLHTQKADVLISATGKAELIRADMIKEGVVIIDVGFSSIILKDSTNNPILNSKGKPKKKYVGDVDFDAVKEKASMITPVPGGVGPLTIAMLLKNTLIAFKNQLL